MLFLNAIGAHYPIIPRRAMKGFGCYVAPFPLPPPPLYYLLPTQKEKQIYITDGTCLPVPVCKTRLISFFAKLETLMNSNQIKSITPIFSTLEKQLISTREPVLPQPTPPLFPPKPLYIYLSIHLSNCKSFLLSSFQKSSRILGAVQKFAHTHKFVPVKCLDQ